MRPQVAFHGVGMNTVERRRHELRLRAAVRIRDVDDSADAAVAHVAWWLRSVAVGPEVWRRHVAVGRRVYTPQSLAGLGTTTTFLHTQATVGIDSRHSPGYTRRGGFYGVTGHDYTDRDEAFGFRQVDYEATQHVPILREAWVLSLHGLVTTTLAKRDQATPFYMMPSLGGGSTLRGFSSSRFSDQHSLLLQAEWRIMANRFVESAVFYDAGKVAARTSDLDLHHLKSDYGIGLRIHAPMATVLRIDVARSTEGTRLVFAASPAF